MATNKLLLMISQFLFGDYDPEEFSWDFPAELVETHADLEAENHELAEILNEEMPETCSWFDPYNTGDEGTINESQFRQQVMETYQKAVAIAARAKKVS